MITFFILPLQESLAQHGASKHHQWGGYMTVLVVSHGNVKSLSILTAVICLMIKCDVNKLAECVLQEVE
jgi:hypothetical protein